MTNDKTQEALEALDDLITHLENGTREWCITHDHITTIREALTAPAVPEWQPIETAPKDGLAILLWGGELEAEISAPEKYYEPVKAKYSNGAWKVCDGCYYEVVVNNPTHWMPLPQPPKGSDDE